MTFYFYTPVVELPATRSVGLILQVRNSAFSPEFPQDFGGPSMVTGVVTASGGHTKAIGAASSQRVSAGGADVPASPWGLAFDQFYGTGLTGGLTFGKLLGVAATGVGAAHATAATGHSQSSGSASAEAAGLRKKTGHNAPSIWDNPWDARFQGYFGVGPIGAPGLASTMAIGLQLARPTLEVFAVTQAGAASIRRTASKLLAWVPNPFDPRFSLDFGSPYMAVAVFATLAGLAENLSTTSSETETLALGYGKQVQAVSPNAGRLLRTTARVLAGAIASAAHSLLAQGRAYKAVSGEALLLIKRQPLRVLVAQVQSSTLTRIMSFTRTFGVAAGSVVGMVRGLFVSRSIASTAAISSFKTVGRILNIAATSVSAIVRSRGGIAQAAQSQSVSGLRQTQLPRRIASATIVLGQFGAQRFLAFSVPIAEAAGLSHTYIAQRLLRIAGTEVVGILTSLTHSVPKSLSSGHGQALALANSIGRRFSVAALSALSMLRAVSTSIRGATSPQVVSRVPITGLVRAVAQAQALYVQASLIQLFQTTADMVANAVPIFGKSLGAVTVETAAYAVALAKGVNGTITQAAGAVRTSIKVLSVALTSVVHLPLGYLQLPAVSTLIASFSVGAKGFTISSALSANVASLGRRAAKLLRLGSGQSAAQGRIEFISLLASQTNAASVMPSFSVILSAAQSLVALLGRWFYPFIPPWAYQDVVLLPPDGGPAEPPCFGPFDPQDNTLFGFDWSMRAIPNDPIVSATIVSVPPGVNFASPVDVNQTLVRVMVGSFTPKQLPATYLLRCTATFASGRRSSFSVPFQVRSL